MDAIQEIIDSIRTSPKYRHLNLPDSTLRDIVTRELQNHRRPKDGLKAARAKLHRVIAMYLGDPDYVAVQQQLSAVFASGSDPRPLCAEILSAHDSTRERLEIASDFFSRLFAITGVPGTLLDVACGLNPLFFPWMHLDALTLVAYDIQRQRVDFLNAYITLQPGLNGLCIQQDILVDLPREAGDVALLLKEIHRFEDRHRGSTRPLLDALQTRWIAVSLPTRNLTGQRDLRERHRALFERVTFGANWKVTEIEFSNELVFCIDKG